MNNPETTQTPASETFREEAQRVKSLVAQIFDSRYRHGEMPVTEAPLREELDAMPREALILAAWEGIANYHKGLRVWGETEWVRRIGQEKDFRVSLLTAEEAEQAIGRANDWLDDNLSQ